MRRSENFILPIISSRVYPSHESSVSFIADEDAIFVERVVAARRVVIEVEHFLRGFLQRLLRPLPLDHHAQDIGHGLEEIDFVLGERSAGCWCALQERHRGLRWWG